MLALFWLGFFAKLGTGLSGGCINKRQTFLLLLSFPPCPPQGVTSFTNCSRSKRNKQDKNIIRKRMWGYDQTDKHEVFPRMDKYFRLIGTSCNPSLTSGLLFTQEIFVSPKTLEKLRKLRKLRNLRKP